jgi:hypothetical protein
MMNETSFFIYFSPFCRAARKNTLFNNLCHIFYKYPTLRGQKTKIEAVYAYGQKT